MIIRLDIRHWCNARQGICINCNGFDCSLRRFRPVLRSIAVRERSHVFISLRWSWFANGSMPIFIFHTVSCIQILECANRAHFNRLNYRTVIRSQRFSFVSAQKMKNSISAKHTWTLVLHSELTSPNRLHPFLYFVGSHSMLDWSAMKFELASSVFRPQSSANLSFHRHHLASSCQRRWPVRLKVAFECSSRRIFYGIGRNRLFPRNKCQLSPSFCHFSPPEIGNHIN